MTARAENANARRPRVLVTGFGPFPGAPENPSEALVNAFAVRSPVSPSVCDLALEVLPVEYAAVPERLSVLGRDFSPDIAIHFGLSDRARGFTLERLARNEIRAEKPDIRGEKGGGGPIREGAGDLVSTLPLKAIAETLSANGLPVYWSDDAGGYLCNYLFFLSQGHLCGGFAPAMAGFIHVPPLRDETFTGDMLERGALAVIETCCRNWMARSGQSGP
ncbi:pyroglutamyl-peptidase I [Chelativorans sp. YIM 93263]|uniref:pyroglutamyl-peptidase I n=1 Tax=Chelativorans sp. YIM 93263 TaxID=2906648 RepID=UPI002378E213|nr:pyroglutamyl-peptidase I [Chelativorans sp. YIM 93263]